MKRSLFAAPRVAHSLVFSFFSLLSVAALPRGAAAQPPASPPPAATAPATVYVVEVATDRLDAERLRAAIGRELGVTAVPPDDARASAASARLRIETRSGAKSVTVTFAKGAPPVTRTVDLPDDAQAAERAAVFLVGNVARDEAGEILGGLAKPKTPAEHALATPPVSSDELRDAEALARMRAVLANNAEAGRRRRTTFVVGGYVASAAMLGAGISVLVVPTSEEPSITPSEGNATRVYLRTRPLDLFGVGLLGASLSWTTFATVVLLSRSPDEDLYKKLKEVQTESSDGEAVRIIEREWYDRAREARAGRHLGGVLVLVLGGLGVGGSLLWAGLSGSSELSPAVGMLFGVSLSNVTAGVGLLASETPLETSYRTWRALHEPPKSARTPTLRPSIGAAPLPGGGMISLGLAF